MGEKKIKWSRNVFVWVMSLFVIINVVLLFVDFFVLFSLEYFFLFGGLGIDR